MTDFIVERYYGGEVPAAAIEIRRQVFIEGQGIRQRREQDGLDIEADHYLAYAGGEPVATTRVRYVDGGATAKIERVGVLLEHRDNDYGLKLMQLILDDLASRDIQTATLEAQTDVQKFYEKLGFTAVGSEFMDADILHIKMVRAL